MITSTVIIPIPALIDTSDYYIHIKYIHQIYEYLLYILGNQINKLLITSLYIMFLIIYTIKFIVNKVL